MIDIPLTEPIAAVIQEAYHSNGIHQNGHALKAADDSLVNGHFHSSSTIAEDAKPICQGRVARLVDKVPEAWWKTVFADSMYLKTDGDVVEDPDITKDEIQQLIAFLPQVERVFQRGVDSNGPGMVLDLCCGQGRHSLQLAHDYPNLKVHGVDQSSYLISLAKERAITQKVASQTCFSVADCRQIPYPDATFDLVLLLGNSFGYFSDADQDIAVLKEVFRVLRPGGRLVIDLTDGEYMRENYSERSWEWVDDTTFVCRERQLSEDKTRLYSREIITITEKGVVRDQFYQERLYSRSDISILMNGVGLDTSESQETVFTANSKRNEDLGMMDHRIVVTGFKPCVNITQVTASPIVISEVKQSPAITILLGDPSKPCVGKLNNSWNQEDIETREKLVAAILAAGYTADVINVVDCHDSLLSTLIENKPSFVFNLCDEGWNNEALKELHVPALLEMLEIPYSGAGPNCLAFCYDKGLVNRSAEALGIPTPKEITFLGSTFDLNQLQAVTAEAKYPAFVKPVKGDNSLGITVRSIVNNFEELVTYANELKSIDLADILIQEYLQGDEYGVGMIGNTETGFKFLPIIQVNYSKILDKKLPPILGFESKWDPKSPYWNDISFERANLSPEREQALQNSCKILWERFGCRDYARFDFRSDSSGQIKLLEVNPNPGWCWDGKFAYMGRLDGLEYSEVLDLILKASWKRLGL